jgi:hypothetical protein
MSADNSPTPPLIVTIEPQTRQKFSYEAKHYRLDHARFKLDREAYRTAHWTMILLAIYTFFTLVVAVGSIWTVYISDKQLALSERPWVGVQNFHCTDCKQEFKADGTTLHIGELGLTLTNTGHTPAQNMFATGTWAIRKYRDPIPKFEDTAKDQQAVWKSFGWTADTAKNIAPEILKRWAQGPRYVLPPNGPYDQLIVKGLAVPYGLPSTDLNENVIVYGVGIVLYTDQITKKQHTTRFCIFSGGDGLFHYCTSGNEMD